MRIGYATADWSASVFDVAGAPEIGGAGWYRCGQPAKYLAKLGHDVVVGKLAYNEEGVGLVAGHDDTAHTDLDILVLQRWMGADVLRITRATRLAGTCVVNDVDDHFDCLPPSNAAWARTHPAYKADTNVEHYARSMAAGSMLTVSTPGLHGHYRRKWPQQRVELLRNTIDLDLFPSTEPRETDRPVVGWVGGVMWRTGDLEELRGILGPFLARHGLAFHHGGHLPAVPLDRELAEFRFAHGLIPAELPYDEEREMFFEPVRPIEELLGIPAGVEVTREEMLPISQYHRLIDPIDIGLVPLARNRFNTEGKSHLKGLEYAAAGKAFVASAVPEYLELERLGIGRTAARPRDWTRHLTELLDPEVRMAEGRRNRALIVEHFNAADRVGEWERAYERLIEVGP